MREEYNIISCLTQFLSVTDRQKNKTKTHSLHGRSEYKVSTNSTQVSITVLSTLHWQRSP